MSSGNEENKYILAGGMVAFGLSMAILSTLDAVYPLEGERSLGVNLFEGFLLYILTSAAASFLITYKVVRGHIITSLKMGGFAFVVNSVIMVVFQTLYGIVWIFLGYMIGGLIGGSLAKLYSSRRNVTKPS